MSVLDRALIAAGHPLVSDAAARILAAGGNAFDAVIAAGFASVVAEHTLTSLGGGGFLLARTGRGKEVLFDFFVNTPGLGLTGDQLTPHFFPITVNFPGSAQDFNVGAASVAVPGNLQGFLNVHDRLGHLPLTDILQPAIGLARGGWQLNDSQAYFLRLLEPIMTLSADGRRLFGDGDHPRPGRRLDNPELADFLEKLPEDRGRSFYRGDLAETMARMMREKQGLLTAADLAAYRVVERRPLKIDYRGRTLLTNPWPAVGGSLIGLSLSLLAERPVGAGDWGSAAHLLHLAEVMIEVEKSRAPGLAPDPRAGRQFHRGTTHISVADRQGNVAAMTTSNGEGSGCFVPGTGIMLNNMMGEDDLHPAGFHASPPALRVGSMMAPALLLEKGQVRLVLGSGGSKRIRTALVQVLSHIVDFEKPLIEAITAPRLHWDGTVMQVEPGWPAAVAALKERWPVNVWPGLDVYFGGVHAVAPGREAAADPRRGGAVAIVQP